MGGRGGISYFFINQILIIAYLCVVSDILLIERFFLFLNREFLNKFLPLLLFVQMTSPPLLKAFYTKQSKLETY